MITVTITDPRRIAGATAAFRRAVEPGTVTDFVQAHLDRLADQWVDQTKVDQISVGEFVLRFTGAEFAAITAAADSDANVAAILATLRARDSVRLWSVDAVNGIAYLVASGLLTSERGAEVLRYEVPG